MLLVDHHEAEVPELDALFDQRVRADEDVACAAEQFRGDLRALFLACRAGQQAYRSDPFGQPRNGGEVLCGEDFGRGHQAGLEAVVDRDQHAHQRDERLAAAHVPLQQAVHLVAGGGVLPDFANHALLRAGEREGEPLAVKTVELFADGGEEKTVVLAYALLPVGEDHELHAEEFLELEPQFGGFEPLVVCGKVDVVQRVAQRREPVLFEDALRQRLGDPFPGERPRVADEVVDRFGAEAFVVELFGGAVDALHACGGPVLLREGRFDLGVHEAERAVEEGWAAENDVFTAHFELLFDPADSFEPDQFGRAGTVAHGGDETFFRAASRVLEAGDARPELDVGERIVANFADAVEAGAVDVAVRVVAQQVAHGADAQLRAQQVRARLADAREELDIVVEWLAHVVVFRSLRRCGGKSAPVV